MNKFEFQVILDSIAKYGYYYFGNREFECSNLDEEIMDFYLKQKRLPKPCDECYKALIFLEDSFLEENISNLFTMLRSLGSDYRGKLDQEVVVFYFRKKSEMLAFLDLLEIKMPQFNVTGRLQWRRACKAFQIMQPNLWKNAKIFIPDPGI